MNEGARASRWHDPAERERLLAAIALGVVFGYLASLATLYSGHVWIIDAHRHPVVEDFAAFWSAGHLAIKGSAIAAYDPRLEHAAEVATIGHGFAGTLGWSYPPAFLFVADLLARLPYVPAFLAWCLGTLGLYAFTVAQAAPWRMAFLCACAAPWVLTALTPGQNGFLTAALMGLGLVHLERRPALAGLFFGLLSYKPQFGILVPLALAAGGYWRTIGAAATAAIVVNLAAGLAFGFDTFWAFLHGLGHATQSHLTVGGLGWSKLQSPYGLARALGLPTVAAWAVQVTATAMLAFGVALAWRARIAFALKAAALATAAVIATPYVFVYDLPVLSVAVAFLARTRRFDRAELLLLAATIPAVFAFLWLSWPSAFFASLAVGAIVLKRIVEIRRAVPAEPPPFASVRQAGAAT